MMKRSWMKLAALVVGGSTIFQIGTGCLNDFWNGFFNDGWPSGNRWLNITIDVLNEELFG